MRNIVKYSNRKLYDAENSRYITITELVREPLTSFEIKDHKTGVDLTTQVLLSSLSTEQPKETKVRVMQHLSTILSQ